MGLIGHAGPSSEIFAFLSSWTFRINTLVLINMVLYNANYVIMSDHEYFMALNSILILACSKRSDSGERCEVKIAIKSRGGLGREVRERL